MSYNTSDINKLKQQIKQYYSFIKNDGMILTNFAKYLLSKADMNLEQAIINLKDMSIKDIQNKLYDLTLELNTGNEISDIIKIKIDEENKKFNKNKNEIENELKNLNKIHTELLVELSMLDNQMENKKVSNKQMTNILELEINKLEKNKKDLNNDLSLLKDTIDGIYRNEIYDNEYNHDEAHDIIKFPIIHLKNNFNLKNISLNFPIEVKLQENEYIIKHYITMANKNISGSCYDFSSQYDMNKNFYVIYITNYGRLIKSETVMFYISKQNWETSMGRYQCYYYDVCVTPIKNIKDNRLISYTMQTTIEIGRAHV